MGFIMLYMLACTLYGMSHVGVRILCIRTHSLRPGRTSTQGVLFMIVKAYNKTKKPVEEAPALPAAPTQEELLIEIRDLLKK